MPIQLTCPRCGSGVTAADQHAGQSVLCVNCGAVVAVPGPHGQPAYAEAVPAGEPPRKMSTGLIVAIVVISCCLPVFCCTGAVGVALFLPAVQAAREAARRIQCSNNMKQIGLALHTYHTIHRSFPPAYLPDEDGRPMHSWRVLILPYLEQERLYDQYRFDEPWNSPHNSSLAVLMPSVFRCPSDPLADETTTSYAMVVGPEAFSPGPEGRRMRDFDKGLSRTPAVVEMAGAGIHWMEPRDWDATGPDQPGSYHPGVVNVLYADGSVIAEDTWDAL